MSDLGTRWQYVGGWRVLPPRELGAQIPGTVRTYDLDGILVSVHKQDDGTWRLTPRVVPTHLLHGRPSRERVRVDVHDEVPS